MIKQIAHICITANDLAETEAFYCDGLGMTRRFEFRKDDAQFGYYLEVGGTTFIEVFQGQAPGTDGGIRHMCLETDDIDALIARLDEKGIAHNDKKLGADQSWQVWVTDPNGVKIEFHQYTDNSSQRTGRVCEVNW